MDAPDGGNAPVAVTGSVTNTGPVAGAEVVQVDLGVPVEGQPRQPPTTTSASGTSTPEEFLDQLPEPRRSEVAQLDAAIRAAVPELARIVQAEMLGYGPYRYLPERYADRFPKASIGRSCIRITHAADLDPEDLTELLRKAAATPAAKA